MKRTSLVVGAAALLVFSAQVAAHQRPDFSGTWTVSMPGKFPAERRIVITQDATTLTIESTAFHIGGSFDGVRVTGSSYPIQVRTTYVPDGIERPSAVVWEPQPALVSLSSPKAITFGTVESSSRALWKSNHLVIVRYEKQRVTAPSRTPEMTTIRRTIRDDISLTDDGRLVWEKLSISDPLPWGTAPMPTPTRIVYTRSQ